MHVYQFTIGSFELLIYTDKDLQVPEVCYDDDDDDEHLLIHGHYQSWEESDPKYVKMAQEVFPLRSFSTNVHKV